MSNDNNPSTPIYVVAVSWTNDGTAIDTSGLVIVAGCKRCPNTALAATESPQSYAQSTWLTTGHGGPKCLLIVSFQTLAAAKAWKEQVKADFDMVYWLRPGLCA